MIQEKSFLCLMIIFFNLFLASHHADKVIFSLGTRLRGRCPSVIGSRPSKSKIINLTRLEKKKILSFKLPYFFPLRQPRSQGISSPCLLERGIERGRAPERGKMRDAGIELAWNVSL